MCSCVAVFNKLPLVRHRMETRAHNSTSGWLNCLFLFRASHRVSLPLPLSICQVVFYSCCWGGEKGECVHLNWAFVSLDFICAHRPAKTYINNEMTTSFSLRQPDRGGFSPQCRLQRYEDTQQLTRNKVQVILFFMEMKLNKTKHNKLQLLYVSNWSILCVSY